MKGFRGITGLAWFLFTPQVFLSAARCQPSGPGSNVDSLHARMTLEDVLEIDPSDPFLEQGILDGDIVADSEPGGQPKAVLRPLRSSVILGYAGSWDENQAERRWSGPANRALIRMDLQITPGISIGCTGEKDAGEQWDLGFRSAYLAIRDLPHDAECVLGDYRLQAGCGLVIGSVPPPMGVEESARRLGASRPELIPHRSREEFNFFRGAALRLSTLLLCPSHILAFGSRRYFSSAGSDDVSSLSQNTLYRTDSEIRRRDLIRESAVGGRLSMEPCRELCVGITLLDSRFQSRLDGFAGGELPGSHVTVAGADISVRTGSLSLKGEVARSAHGGGAAALVGAVTIKRSAFVTLAVQSLSARFANHRYEGFVTAAPSNETGFKLSGRWIFSPFTHIEGYLRQRWTSAVPMDKTSPSIGWNGGVGGVIGFGRTWEFHWLYRSRRGEGESSDPVNEGGTRRHRIVTGADAGRFSLHYHLGVRAECQTSLQAVRCSEDKREGTIAGEQVRQEIHWKPAPWMGVSATGTLFSAQSFAARTSSLEDDPISRMRYEPLDGEGFRWALSLTLSPPGTGLSALFMVAGSDQVRLARPDRVPQRGVWGVRVRWID